MTGSPRHRVLLSQAGPEAYAPLTRRLLGKLGYRILDPEELEEIADAEGLRPVLLLLDERQMAELTDSDQELPILVLASRDDEIRDPRVAGVVKRPADTRELYRMIQQLTEETPRTTPRVETHLPATCRRGQEQWLAVVLSLSERGCLLSRSLPLEPGTRFELSFELPGVACLEIAAKAVYRRSHEVGLVFPEIADEDREAIARFVTATLLH